MIQWSSFENELANYFDSRIAKSEDDAARRISDLYDRYIKTGETIYKNRIIKSNKSILEDFIKRALKSGRAGSISTIVSLISCGILLYWRAVIVDTIMPPPGTVSVVSNIVINPGAPLNFQIRNSMASKLLAKNMITAFKLHTFSVSGINTAVTYVMGTIVPIGYPWSGIR